MDGDAGRCARPAGKASPMTTTLAPLRAGRPRGRLFARFDREITAAGLPEGPGDERPVTDDDIAGLPPAVQRYLRFMGVVGRARDWSFRARFAGRFRLRPDGPWMPAQAWQYNSAITTARVFVMRIRFAGVIPMVGVDSYLHGRGRMLGKLLRVVTVADGEGEEFDIGELTTYLNDAVLLAPSFLLRPAVTWAEVDDTAFDVALADSGRIVTGRVSVDERGAPVDFCSRDRFAVLRGGLQRAEWHTPIAGWTRTVEGRALPGPLAAMWALPEGDLTYFEGRIDPAACAFNIAPGR